MTQIYDKSGNLTFDYFIKVYKASMIWNRILFADKKKDLVSRRRTAIKNKDMDEYKAVLQTTNQLYEESLSEVLSKILGEIKLTKELLQNAFGLYQKDTEKNKIISKVTSEAYFDQGEGMNEEEK